MPKAFSQIRYTPPAGHGPIEGPLLAAAEAVWRQLAAEVNAAREAADSAANDEQVYEAQQLRLPSQLLNDYRSGRAASDLGQILDAAAELAAEVDRVAIIGDALGGTADLFFRVCAHPYFNELSRAERGGQPRLYFMKGAADNDRLAGWLDLVAADARLAGPQGSWGIVAVHSPKTCIEIEWTLAILLDALWRSCQSDEQTFARRFVSVGGPELPIANQQRFASARRLPLPTAARFGRGLFLPVGLLPAALAGLDVRRPLEAAARLTDRFCKSKPASNPIVQFAAQPFTMGSAIPGRIFGGPSGVSSFAGNVFRRKPQLAASGPAESYRTFWSTEIVADRPLRDRLAIPDELHAPTSPAAEGEPHWLVDELDRRWAERLQTMRKTITCDILRFDRFEPAAVGELCQWLMIAAVFQTRLAAVL